MQLSVVDQAEQIVRDHRRKIGTSTRPSAIFELGEGRLCVQGMMECKGRETVNDRTQIRFSISAEGHTFEVLAFGWRADKLQVEDFLETVVVTARLLRDEWVMSADLIYVSHVQSAA